MNSDSRPSISVLLLCLCVLTISQASPSDQTALRLGTAAANYTLWSAKLNNDDLYFAGLFVEAGNGLVQYYEDAHDITHAIIDTYVGSSFRVEEASDSGEVFVHRSLEEARASHLAFELGLDNREQEKIGVEDSGDR